MDLAVLKDLGLPEWVIIIAALVFIAKQVGLWDYVFSNLADKREHAQASENIAIDVLREIVRESITEHSKEQNELVLEIKRLGIRMDGLAQSVRALAGIIDEKGKGDGLRRYPDEGT